MIKEKKNDVTKGCFSCLLLSKCTDLDSFQDEAEQSCKGNNYWLFLPVLVLIRLTALVPM